MCLCSVSVIKGIITTSWRDILYKDTSNELETTNLISVKIHSIRHVDACTAVATSQLVIRISPDSTKQTHKKAKKFKFINSKIIVNVKSSRTFLFSKFKSSLSHVEFASGHKITLPQLYNPNNSASAPDAFLAIELFENLL